MIVSVRLTPGDFFDTYFYGFRDRPRRNGLAIGLPLVVIAALLGLKTAATLALGILGTVGLTYLLVMGIMYFIYKNNDKQIPLTYKVTPTSVKITYGNKNSHVRDGKLLRKKDIQKVWVFGRCIFIRHRFMTYCILIPDTRRTLFYKDMRAGGWFDLPRPQIKSRLVYNAAQIGLTTLAISVFALTFGVKPADSSAAQTYTPVRALTTQKLLAAVNGERQDDEVQALKSDNGLKNSSAAACSLLTNGHKPTEDQPAIGAAGGVQTRQFYDGGQWISEISVAVQDGTTNSQLLSRWINNYDANGIIADSQYNRAGVAICENPTDDSFTKAVVIHLAQ